MNFLSITHSLDESQNKEMLYHAVVNTPFSDKLHATELGLGIVVLLLVNNKDKTLDRIALSDTEMAKGAVAISAKPFHEIRIPLNSKENILITTLMNRQPQFTEDWAPMFVPELTAEEARFNQAGAAIACSATYPLLSFDGQQAFGVLIFSYYEPMHGLGDRHYAFMKVYTDTVAAKLAELGHATS